MASTLVKTIRPEPITMQQLAAGASIVSSVIDVSSTLSARVFFDTALIASVANAPPPAVELQASKAATGNDGWFVVRQRRNGRIPASVGHALVTSAITAGDTVFNTSNAIWSFNFIQTIFALDPTFSLSEWNRILSRSGTVNTVADPFLNSHPINTTLFYRGLRSTFSVDVFALKRIRFCVYNNSTIGSAGPALYAVRVALITTDSLI